MKKIISIFLILILVFSFSNVVFANDLIKTIDISVDDSQLVKGSTPAAILAAMTIPEDAKYTIEKIGIKNATSGFSYNAESLAYGNNSFLVNVSAKNSATFSNDVTISLNSDILVADSYFTNIYNSTGQKATSNDGVTLEFLTEAFNIIDPETVPRPINSLNINFNIPKFSDTAGSVINSVGLNNDNIEIVKVDLVDCNIATPLSSSASFQEGKTYSLCLTMQANKPYYFANTSGSGERVSAMDLTTASGAAYRIVKVGQILGEYYDIYSQSKEVAVTGLYVEIDFTVGERKQGDVDGNGTIDSNDVADICRLVLVPENVSSADLKVADMNNDKKIDIHDAIALLNKIVGL